MAKKKGTTIEEIVNESVEKKLQQAGVSDQDEDSPIVRTEDLPDSIKPLLSSFPSAEGYHGRIYKISANGDWQTMDYRIESPETIPDGDLEGEVRRIVKQKGWGNGDYRVQIRRQGERSLYVNKKVSINEAAPVQEHNPVNDGLGIAERIMSISQKSQVNPDTMGNTILRAVEVGRNMVPAPESKGNGADSQLVSLLNGILPLIIPLVTKPQLDENSIVDKVVTRLQPTLQPKGDNLTELIKLKEGLGMKFAHETKREDTLDSVHKVTDIIAAIKPLAGGGSGEPPSTLGLILEHLPKLVEPLLTTFKEFAEAKKMEMKLRMDQYYGGVNSQIDQSNPRNLPAPHGMHPFAMRIIKAVNENDESYFDMMRQQVSRLYGQHVIDGLVSGNLTSELVIETLQTELGVPVTITNLKPYIEKFIKYLQESKDEADTPGILAECKVCKTQYDFPDMKAWEADIKTCEDCQGDLILVRREGEA